MNKLDLENFFIEVQNRIIDTKRLLYTSSECDLGEPDENAKAGIDALELYLQKADDVIAWLKGNLKEPVDDLREILEGVVSPIPVGEPKKLSVPKDYGKISEENVLKVLEDKGVISTSMLQRIFAVGYGRAAQMIDLLSYKGYIVHTKTGWVKNK